VGPPPKRVLNSLCSVEIILNKKINFFEGIAQNIGAIIVSATTVLIQFNGSVIREDGSKLENKLAIIVKVG
jgi:hypothetical protein